MVFSHVQPSTNIIESEKGTYTSRLQANFRRITYIAAVASSTAIGGFFGGLAGYLIATNITKEEQTYIATAYTISGVAVGSGFALIAAIFTLYLCSKPKHN